MVLARKWWEIKPIQSNFGNSAVLVGFCDEKTVSHVKRQNASYVGAEGVKPFAKRFGGLFGPLANKVLDQVQHQGAGVGVHAICDGLSPTRMQSRFALPHSRSHPGPWLCAGSAVQVREDYEFLFTVLEDPRVV